MYLGRVIGTVVATRKYEGLEGKKLLVVTPLNHRKERAGEDQVAVDTVRAGHGDLVYLVGSREAALALGEASAASRGSSREPVASGMPETVPPWFVPVDAAIVGIVDDVDAK